MRNKNVCANTTCSCTTREGERYCSEYCKQAVGQAVERHYCQYEHACDTASTGTTFVLPGSRIPSNFEPELQSQP